MLQPGGGRRAVAGAPQVSDALEDFRLAFRAEIEAAALKTAVEMGRRAALLLEQSPPASVAVEVSVILPGGERATVTTIVRLDEQA